MSAPVSIREFARLDGCNEKLVRRAIQEQRLSVNEDGKLDSALAGTGWRAANRRADTAADKSADSRGAAVSAPVGAELTDEFLDDFVSQLLSGKFASRIQAERVKENALALKHLLEARRRAGELVDIDTAKGALFEAARTQRDAWLNFPTRIGPLMAADLSVEPEPLIEALTAHVHKQLSDLGEPAIDFADAEGTA